MASSDTTLELTRIFLAPRDRVFAAWTDLEQMDWWGPEGCQTLNFEADLQPGGKWRWDLRSQGEEMTARGEYRKLLPGKQMVYTWQWADDPDWDCIESLITIDFRDAPNGATELHLVQEGFPNRRSRDNHIGGWSEALGKLERQLAS